MFALNQTQLLSRLNQAQTGERIGISRQTFEQSLRPLMVAEGVAQNISEEGSQPRYVYNAKEVWRWVEYVQKRRALIEQGIAGWHSKRPYSIEDMYALVDDGVYDGEIDHEIFAVVNDQGEQT